MAGTVLVGVDGSDTAQKAARRAASIAQGIGAGAFGRDRPRDR